MTWTAIVSAVGGVATPLCVLGVGYLLNQRLKAVEAAEWKHQELIKARMEIFREISPLLNDLMCYPTFIGRWARMSPPEVVSCKRDLDRLFFSVEPLFTPEVRRAYDAFMAYAFEVFVDWGKDAKIRTGWGRRKEAWTSGEWQETWQSMFTHEQGQSIPDGEQTAVRNAYASLLTALADDVKITPVRIGYGTLRVSGSAH